MNKMEQLYRNEMRFKKKQAKKFNQMQSAHVISMQPVRDILGYYNELSVRGFDSTSIIGSLKQLNKALRGRGNKGRVMNDYSHAELDQSWKMHKLVDDIKFGLNPE